MSGVHCSDGVVVVVREMPTKPPPVRAVHTPVTLDQILPQRRAPSEL